MTKQWTAEVIPDPNDSEGCALQFPEDMMAELGWKEGDTLAWTDLPDGSVSIRNITQVEGSTECESDVHQ